MARAPHLVAMVGSDTVIGTGVEVEGAPAHDVPGHRRPREGGERVGERAGRRRHPGRRLVGEAVDVAAEPVAGDRTAVRQRPRATPLADEGRLPDDRLEEIVEKIFDARPANIIRELDLLRPIYSLTAAYGHFGRHEPEFTWERTDRAEALAAAAG